MQTREAIEAARQALGNWVWVLLKIGLFAGALSMAIIQIFKDQLHVRQVVQKLWFRKWFEMKANTAPLIDGSEVRHWKAQKSLIQLATAGDGGALYGLPVEQLCGQIVAAMQAALDSPSAYADLVYCLGQGTPARVLEHKVNAPAESTPASDLDLIRKPPGPEIMRMTRELLEKDPTAAKKLEDYSAARNRVLHQVQRSVDSLQIALGRDWKLYMQRVALILSILASASIAVYGNQPVKTVLGVAILSGLIGGFFAPILRDALAVIERLRK